MYIHIRITYPVSEKTIAETSFKERERREKGKEVEFEKRTPVSCVRIPREAQFVLKYNSKFEIEHFAETYTVRTTQSCTTYRMG